jgi:3-dehydroquinate dehydratase-1
MSDVGAASKAGADILEIRADFFPRSLLKPVVFRNFLEKIRQASDLPLLLTLRARSQGGHLPRGFREQDRLGLFRAGLSEVEAVDVELSADAINSHVVSEAHKRGCSVIVSHHDFQKTPSDIFLRALVRKALRLKGDLLKVAAWPTDLKDVDRFMDFCRRSSFPRRAFIAMGSLGKGSRLDGFHWGSCLTYGYVRKPLAPGQMKIKKQNPS